MSNEILSMSDEELMNYVFEEESNTQETSETEQTAPQEPVSTADEQTNSDDEMVNDESDDAVQDNTQANDGDFDDVADTDTVNEPQKENQPDEVDYQTFYQKMTTPFKANGREIHIDNADDAIRLMQMGANYSKKMEALKPKQALLRALEENGLTSKEQLGYLIDLANKKPEAIAKLIQESQIDLYDFDTAQADNYQPTEVIKEPTLFENTLQEVLEINPEMYQIVQDMSAWDSESKDVIYSNPNILRIMSEQQSNGTYAKIVNKIANEKLFGRLNGMNFLQAYSLYEKEFLDNQSSFTAPRPTQTKTNQPQPNNKSKASLPNASNKTAQAQMNPLSMSDEELLAYLQSQS